MFKQYNANPACNRGDDCTVRAISTVLGKRWQDVYLDLCEYGLKFYDMPSANHVWGAYLTDCGFKRHIIPNTCPACYTVENFADDHKNGRYILALHGHVVAVVDGNYYDTWNSGSEVPLYYWRKEKD